MQNKYGKPNTVDQIPKSDTISAILSSERLAGDSFGSEFNSSELELFRVIPKSVSEPFGIMAKKYENSFAYRLVRNGQKLIRLNSIHFASIRMNPNQSETSY